MRDWLYEMTGIKIMVLIAGTFGGIIQLALTPGLSVMGAIVSVLAGVCCAAFLTPSIHIIYDLPLPFENAVAFLFGLIGMTLTGKIYMAFRDFDIRDIFSRFIKK
jgi:hypothetical protein